MADGITWSQKAGMAWAVIMAGAAAWGGIHEYNSIPAFEQARDQYMAQKRPEAVKSVLRTQFEDFQSQYRSHSFDSQGPLAVTFDPNAPATQAAADKKLQSDFNAEVTNKKVMPFIMEPAALLLLAIACIPLVEEHRRRHPRPRPEINWPKPPPPPRTFGG